MKHSVAGLIVLMAIIGCTAEVPVTVEVTKIAEVTREVEATREVEVTRLVEVTREVEVTRVVELVRDVLSTVEVEVTRVVEVTREVPKFDLVDLCADYGYIFDLGDLQRNYFTVALKAARRSLPQGDAAIEFGEMNLELVDQQVRTAWLNSATICGPLPFLGDRRPRYEMKTLEGWGVCVDTLNVFNQAYQEPWEQLGQEFEDAMFALLDGFVEYCDNDFLE